MNQNGKEPEGMDWLLAQLADAGGQERRDPADDPYRDAEAQPDDETLPDDEARPLAGQAVSDPTPVPGTGMTAPDAAIPGPPPRPIEPTPESRSEEVLDWFSLADGSPESGDAPAWDPPFTVGDPSATPEAPASPPEAPAPAPPGPVTPTAPFALTYRAGDIETEDSIRAAFRNLSEPAATHETTSPLVPPADDRPATATEPSSSADADRPPVARQTFTPPITPAHPTAPTTAPAGWDEQPPTPVPAKDYDDELWSALNEPDSTPGAPVPPVSAEPTIPAPVPSAFSAPPPPAPEPAPPPYAGIRPVFTGPVELPPPNPAPVHHPGSEFPFTPHAPFPAFAGEPGEGRRGHSSPPDPVDDLLASLVAGSRAPRRDEVPPAADRDDPVLQEDSAVDDELQEPDEAEGAEEAISPIAREIAEAGYFWNLTPDPSAPDPKAELEVEPSAEPNADTGEAPPAEPQVEPTAEPEVEPASDAATAREPDDDWPVAFSAPAVPAATAAAHRSAGHSDGDDDDSLAALFRGTSDHTGAAPRTPPPHARPPAARDAAAAGPVAGAGAAPPRTGGPGTPTPAGGTGTGTGGAGSTNRTTRTLIWIAGGLAALVVLAGLFWVGTLLSGGSGEQAASPPASEAPSEPPVAAPTAPQPVGVHAWNTLFGGECIEPFVSPWDEEFTVVDCADAHAAQLVHRGALPGDAAAPFPGEAEIASQMNLLCTAPGIIDLATVTGINDLQVQASFPVTEEQWADGERTFYCFAHRTGGEPMYGSIAGPGPAA